MTSSLASCADTGVSLPRTEPIDDHALWRPRSRHRLLADFLVRDNGFIRG
jgi:hypothetical protein